MCSFLFLHFYSAVIGNPPWIKQRKQKWHPEVESSQLDFYFSCRSKKTKQLKRGVWFQFVSADPHKPAQYAACDILGFRPSFCFCYLALGCTCGPWQWASCLWREQGWSKSSVHAVNGDLTRVERCNWQCTNKVATSKNTDEMKRWDGSCAGE